MKPSKMERQSFTEKGSEICLSKKANQHNMCALDTDATLRT